MSVLRENVASWTHHDMIANYNVIRQMAIPPHITDITKFNIHPRAEKSMTMNIYMFAAFPYDMSDT